MTKGSEWRWMKVSYNGWGWISVGWVRLGEEGRFRFWYRKASLSPQLLWVTEANCWLGTTLVKGERGNAEGSEGRERWREWRLRGAEERKRRRKADGRLRMRGGGGSSKRLNERWRGIKEKMKKRWRKVERKNGKVKEILQQTWRASAARLEDTLKEETAQGSWRR